MLDERLIHSLHVTSGRHEDLPKGAEPREVFQTSTIAALLDGAYDGDVTFAELARRGDLARRLAPPEQAHAIGVDGPFERTRARPVARQSKPYRPLAEVVSDQHV